MKIEFRLQKVLKDHGLDRRGIVQEMARDLTLHRHTITKIYKNEAATVSLDVLGEICQWLENKGVPRGILPGAIVGAPPSQLWQAIVQRGKVTIYLGEYQQSEQPAPKWRWISRRDAVVSANIVKELSTPGGAGATAPQVSIKYVPFRWDIRTADTNRKPGCEDIDTARRILTDMRSGGYQNNSILIGSQRVNYLLEHFVADMFGCEPFCAPGNIARIPFYLLYREDDHSVQSCFGGTRKKFLGKNATMPGTYYRDEQGTWKACPWKENEEDSGVVITSYDAGTQSMEMALFGFSGRATIVVGNQLLANADRFWPPSAVVNGREIGVYICRFRFAAERMSEGSDELSVQECNIVSLCKKTLKGS